MWCKCSYDWYHVFVIVPLRYLARYQGFLRDFHCYFDHSSFNHQYNWVTVIISISISTQILERLACSVQVEALMSFILKGSQIPTLQLKGWFKSKTSIQEYRNEIQSSYEPRAWIIPYTFMVQCEELRINHLTPFLVVTIPYACWFLWRANYIDNFKWCLHFQVGVALERAILREAYYEGPKGIEDFNLEHC